MNYFSNWSLKNKVLGLILFVFIVVGVFFWQFSLSITQKLDEGWALKYIENRIAFDKYRTLNPIIEEIESINHFKKNEMLVEMAKAEENDKELKRGLELLENSKSFFEDESYFIAFTKTNNYYYNDKSNTYKDNQFRYKLDENNIKDKWFFQMINDNKDVVVNVDKDISLGVTKVWINVLLKEDDKILGVFGTGFDFDKFVQKNINSENENIKQYFINDKLAIQLAQDKEQVDYASFTKKDNQHKKIDVIFDNENDLKNLKNVIKELSTSNKENNLRIINATINGKKYMVGVTYLKNIDWYGLTLIQTNEFLVYDNLLIFIKLIFTLIIVFYLINIILNQLILKPLETLKNQMLSVEKNHKEFPIIGTSEIKQLSLEFNKMLKTIFEEIEKNKRKDKVLIEQSKQASLGAMFGNIAHQWRQPLANIQLIAMRIGIQLKMGREIDANKLQTDMDNIGLKTKYLFENIDTFKNFLKEKKEYKKLVLEDNISLALSIVNLALKDNNITLINEMDTAKKTQIIMVVGELTEVIINIINNAKDVLIERKIENPWIKLELKIDENNAFISIEDNAGGIPKDIQSKIFDEYFTTKSEDLGTGLGLHMSHKIVVESLKGKLYTQNTENGAKFNIVLPLK